MKYKIGITVFDEWNQLWETKIGSSDKKMVLLFSAWGSTAERSQTAAEILIETLTFISIESKS
jgi:hypothetical protein